MSNRRRIIIDVDDVLGDFTGSALRLIENKTGNVHGRDEIVGHDIFNSLNYPEKMLVDAVLYEDFCKNIRPTVGARNAVEHIEKNFGDVYICTAPFNDFKFNPDAEPRWMSQRAKWVNDEMGLTLDRQVHTKAKFLVQGCVLIDDSPKNLLKWGYHNPKGLPILYVHEWNKSSTEFVQGESWEHIFELIEDWFSVTEKAYV